MTPIIIIKTRFGGYLVKSHNPTQYETDVLFAGHAQECIRFIVGYMADAERENTND